MARAETLVSMSMSMNMSMSAAGEVLSLGIPSDLGESTLPMRVPGGYWQDTPPWEDLLAGLLILLVGHCKLL